MAFNTTSVMMIGIGSAVAIIGMIFALFMLPILAGRVVAVKTDPNVSGISGADGILDLVMYIGIFIPAIIGVGILIAGIKASLD